MRMSDWSSDVCSSDLNVDCIQAENTFREIIPELRIREPGRRRSGQLIQLSGQSTDAMERESEGSQPFFQVFLGTLANARATIQQVVLECAEQSTAANVVSNGLLVKDDRHRQTAAIVIDANGDRDQSGRAHV